VTSSRNNLITTLRQLENLEALSFSSSYTSGWEELQVVGFWNRWEAASTSNIERGGVNGEDWERRHEQRGWKAKMRLDTKQERRRSRERAGDKVDVRFNEEKALRRGEERDWEGRGFLSMKRERRDYQKRTRWNGNEE
jgi:hypothetical protein